MKSLLAAVSTLALVTAVPALAADITVQEQFPEEYFLGNKAAGYVDLHYGWRWFSDEFDFDEDFQTAGIYGRANLPFSPTSLFNLQLDGTADTLFVSGKGSFETPLEATAHLYIRDPSRYALGVFGSYGVVDGFDMWGGGVEGQLFLDRFTLYGQGGYRMVNLPSFFPDDFSEWYVRGVGRYFPTDNIRLEGEIGFAQYDFFGLDTIDDLFFSATAEYRFDHFPLGVYAQYRGNYYTDDEGDTANDQAFLLGVRGHLGSDSLFDNDRRGASFDTRAPDPFWYGKFGVI